jgi:hypothetical protein
VSNEWARQKVRELAVPDNGGATVWTDDTCGELCVIEHNSGGGLRRYRNPACEQHGSDMNTKQREHIDDQGRFQSDKYPTTPPDLVPLKVTDPDARDLLAIYAVRRQAVDAEFCDDLLYRLAQTKPKGVR